MPAAAEADGVRAAGAGFLQLTDEQARALISSQPIHQLYDVEEEPFARGKYATVRRCRALDAGSGAPWRFAAKYLRKWRRAADLRPEILHEVAILHACRRSQRVVRLFGVFENEHEMVLLLELAEGGELQTLLDRDIVPDEAQVRQLMRHILLGLKDLHDLNVAHLDIKPQNLVLTGEFTNCDVKLCDLGISRYVGEGADVRDMLGTPDYVAPEVLNYEPISLATDMWSVGVLIYVLLTGCSPFGGDTKQETFCNISQCNLDFPEDLFEDISEDAKDLMRMLMVKDPSNRLTVEQSLQHSWFSAAHILNSTVTIKDTREISSRNSFREADRIASAVSGKLDKSSPALSKKLDRPSPTMMRKPGKEVPEPIKNNDLPHDIPKRTIPVTRDASPQIAASSQVSKSTSDPECFNVSEEKILKDKKEREDSNVNERSNCSMKSFRKDTFKKNMGSILERVTSCEDFENNNGFPNISNKNHVTGSSTPISDNTKANEACTLPKSTNTSISNKCISSEESISSVREISNNITSSSNITENFCEKDNSYSNIFQKNNHVPIKNEVSETKIQVTGASNNGVGPKGGKIHSITASTSITSKNNLIYSTSKTMCSEKTNTVAKNRAMFETNQMSVRLNASSKKISNLESPAINTGASIASLSLPRSTRATATHTMHLGAVREFRLTSSSTLSTMGQNNVNPPTITSIPVARSIITTTTTTTSTPTSTATTSISSASVVVTPPNYRGSHCKNVESDCVYTYRKCYIIDDGENENGNSLVSDGTNESETSSGFYDNSSCCSSSDSVSDVSETSADSAGDRLSTASMDSLDSCFGKEKRPYSSTLATFSVKNNYNKKVSNLKPDVNSKTHQSPAFHSVTSPFNQHLIENTSETSKQREEIDQERIFAAARRQAAKASHTTVINKVSRASFVTSTQGNSVVHKVCALNITKERNGNEVVLQEVKSGKCNRFSEVKIESVQSRIKKFQF